MATNDEEWQAGLFLKTKIGMYPLGDQVCAKLHLRDACENITSSYTQGVRFDDARERYYE